MHKQKRWTRKAFTLVELIIIIVVVGLLAGLAIPKFIGTAKDAQVATLYRDIDTLEKVIPIYYIDHDDYPVFDDSLVIEDARLIEMLQKNGETLDNLYEVNLNETKRYHTKLKHGYKKDNDDFFIYSKNSGRVYYAKGIRNGDGEIVYGYKNASELIKNVFLSHIPLTVSKVNEVEGVNHILKADVKVDKEVTLTVNGEAVPVFYEELAVSENLTNLYASKDAYKTFWAEITLRENEKNKIVITVSNESISFKIVISKETVLKPVAIISMTPEEKITTHTAISWDYSESLAFNGATIVDAEWENKKDIYDTPDTYIVRLRVQDSNGNWSEWTEKTITVQEVIKPTAVIDTDMPNDYVFVGEEINWDYSNSTADNGADIINVEWENKQNVYDTPGTYVVRLRVQDSNGVWSDWVEKTIIVKEKVKPTAVLELDTPHVMVGQKVNWDYSKSTSGNGSAIVNVEWENKKDIYDTPGPQTVRLRVQDEDGLWSDWVEKTFYVYSPTDVKELAVGGAHVIALLYDNTLIGWGTGSGGRLGDGTSTSRKEMKPVADIADVAQVDVSDSSHCLAVLKDGTVRGWGNATWGCLGIGSYGYSTTKRKPLQAVIPTIDEETGKSVDVPLRGIKRVVCGHYFSFGLAEDGTLWSWGDNNSGQLGRETPRTEGNTYYDFYPGKITGLENVVDIDAGQNHAVALLKDGTIRVWGSNIHGQHGIGETSNPSHILVQPIGLNNVVQIKAGNQHIVALTRDGSVYTWGRNTDGELGLGAGAGDPVTIPTKVPGINNAKAIEVGGTSTYVLLEDGSVMAWGNNGFGQLGIGNKSDQFEPVRVLLDEPVQEIRASVNMTFFMLENGLILSCGNDTWGSLANGDIGDTTTPQPAVLLRQQ